LKERLAKLGVTTQPMSVEAFGQFVKDDIAGTAQLAKEAHIEPLD
jgi:hypothetical protein